MIQFEISDFNIRLVYDDEGRLMTIKWRALKPPVQEQPPPPTEVKLDVPWLSQLGKDADFAPGDCGPAIVAQWLRQLGHDVTVNDVSAQVGLDRGFSFTTPSHLYHAAYHWGLLLYWSRGLIVDDLIAEIDAGHPAIVLVNYPSLPLRYDPNYQHGHWLLVVGYTLDKKYLYYHDPYYLDSDGAFVKIRVDDFLDAWGNNHLNGNSDYQALRATAQG